MGIFGDGFLKLGFLPPSCAITGDGGEEVYKDEGSITQIEALVA